MGTNSNYIHTDGPLYQLSFKERYHWSCLILRNLRNEDLWSGRGSFFFTKTVSFSWFFALSLWRHDQVPAKHQFDQNSHRQAALRAPSQTSDNGEVFQQKYFSSLRHIFAKKTLTFVGFFVLYKWMKGETMIGIEGPPTSQGQRCLLRLICRFKPWDVEQAPLVLLVALVLQVLLVLLMPFFFW